MDGKDIFKYYNEEIAYNDNGNLYQFIELILIYKLRNSVESLKFEDEKLTLIMENVYEDTPTPSNECVNTVYFGTKEKVVNNRTINEKYYNKPISYFLNQYQFGDKIEVYVDDEHRNLLIVSSRINSIAINMYLIDSIIPKLLPWIFKSVDEKLKNELKKVAKKELDVYKMLESLIEEKGIKEKMMLKKLAAQIGKLNESRKLDLRKEYVTHASQIDAYVQGINLMRKKIAEINLQLSAIELGKGKNSDIVNELIEYLQMNQSVTICDVVDDRIVISFNEVLSYFDPIEYETHIKDNDGGSYFYTTVQLYTRATDKEIREFWEHIFDIRDFKIHMHMTVDVNISSLSVESSAYPNHKPNSMPQPHIMQYDCFGSAIQEIVSFLKKGRLIEAIEQLRYACKQFTIADIPVGEELIEALFKANYTCIELPNGNFVNGHEALKYLKDMK